MPLKAHRELPKLTTQFLMYSTGLFKTVYNFIAKNTHLNHQMDYKELQPTATDRTCSSVPNQDTSYITHVLSKRDFSQNVQSPVSLTTQATSGRDTETLRMKPVQSQYEKIEESQPHHPMQTSSETSYLSYPICILTKTLIKYN